MKMIPLTNGGYAIVDDADYRELSQYRWRRTHNGYALHEIFKRRKGQKPLRKKLYMHRLVARTPAGLIADHINRDRLDNRRQNIRNCTQKQNSYNVKLNAKNTTGYLGVTKRVRDGRWIAQIMQERKRITIGAFETPEEAALAYNKVALELRGEYAAINHIPTDLMSAGDQERFTQTLEMRPVLPRHNNSGFRGVSWYRGISRWVAEIRVDGKKRKLGSFENRDDAARAYNEAARTFHGEHARLNQL